MTWAPDVPFDDLPPLPPEGVDCEPRSVMRATQRARIALAEMVATSKGLPDPGVLIHALPLLEAQASSEIENIVTTADELFKYADTAATEPSDHATKEALRYRSALFAGVRILQQGRPVTAHTAGVICTTLMGRQMSIRPTEGTRIANPATREVIYAPPHGRDVIQRKLTEWEQFMHARDDLDPLVRMALGHYQFEAIHPFSDGNGRTGRVLNILAMMEAGVLDEPTLYLSRAIIARKNDYYRLLRAVTAEQAWVDWILFMLEAVAESATSTTRKISAIRTCQADIEERARAATPGGRDARFLQVLFEQPYCRISTVVERCEVSRQTASTWLHTLSKAGLLHALKAGREQIFVNHEFLDVLCRPD